MEWVWWGFDELITSVYLQLPFLGLRSIQNQVIEMQYAQNLLFVLIAPNRGSKGLSFIHSWWALYIAHMMLMSWWWISMLQSIVDIILYAPIHDIDTEFYVERSSTDDKCFHCDNECWVTNHESNGRVANLAGRSGHCVHNTGPISKLEEMHVARGGGLQSTDAPWSCVRCLL